MIYLYSSIHYIIIIITIITTNYAHKHVTQILRDDLNLKLPTSKKFFNVEENIIQRMSVGDYTRREDVYTFTIDKIPDIIWKVFTIDGLMKFLDEIDQYQLKYDRRINIYSR